MQKRVYAILSLFALIAFVLGFFASVTWLTILGGLLLVFDEVMEIFSGMLNPTFPIIFAILLALIINPWYIGVFWSITAFKTLNIPTYLSVILRPEKHKSIKEIEDDLKM